MTRERLYLDTMQQVLANTSKIIVDQKSGNNLLFLPLDKLLQIGRLRRVARRSTEACGPAESQPVPRRGSRGSALARRVPQS